jgi:DNA repair exonuclease SbcCD ATPase subunit
MKLPEIPTDNLYKFLAISGIIIFLISYLPLFHSYKLNLQLARLEGESKAVKEEREWLFSDANEVRNELQNLTKQLSEIQKDRKVTEGAEETLKKKLEEKVAKLLEYTQLLHKQSLKTIEIDTKLEELRVHIAMLKTEANLSISGHIIGAILALVGFSLWYKKLQAPQDIIISKQAKAEQKNEELKG